MRQSRSRHTATNYLLTLVLVVGGDCEHGVLDVLVLVHLRLVQALVEVGRVVILVRDADTDELGHCGGTIRYCMFMLNKTQSDDRSGYIIMSRI